MNKAINIFMLLVLLVDAFFIGYWFGLHSHKVLVVQGSDDFLYANTFTEFQSNFTQKKEAVKEKAAEKLEPIKEKRAKAKEARQAETAPNNANNNADSSAESEPVKTESNKTESSSSAAPAATETDAATEGAAPTSQKTTED